jgi:hypothetical protein
MQMEGIAFTVWELAHHLLPHQPVGKTWRNQQGVCYWNIRVRTDWRNGRLCTRYEKLDVMYLAFFNLALIYDELKLC